MELAPRHKFLRAVALSDILKFRGSEMAFSGVSRGILHHRGCHVVSSEYAQDWEQCRRKDCRNVPGSLFERFTDLNQLKYAFNVNQNWVTDASQFPFPLQRGFAWSRHRILPNSQFQKREYKYH